MPHEFGFTRLDPPVAFGEVTTRPGMHGRLMRIRNSGRPTAIPAHPIPLSDPPDPVPVATSASPAGGLWLEQRPSVAEERVLAEISHELGNFFHKLYYWAEF